MQEVQLAAILAPMATAGLRSQVSPEVATLDASPSARATVETQVGKDLASALWRRSERKGTFSRHETQARTLFCEKGLLNASDEVAVFFRYWAGNSYSSWTRRFRLRRFWSPVRAVHKSTGLACRVVLLSHSHSGIGIALGYTVQMSISRFLLFCCWWMVAWTWSCFTPQRLAASVHGSCLGLPLVIVS